MPVTSLLSYLASGMTVEEILKEWPELELEDIYQALGYAACETAFTGWSGGFSRSSHRFSCQKPA
ncbi:MAG: DUF433 domain-containing protein [Anaerolineae bacterium]